MTLPPAPPARPLVPDPASASTKSAPVSAVESKPAHSCCCGHQSKTAPSPHTCPAARTGVALLEQAGAFIQSIDDRSFSSPSRVMAGGTIGKHFRHALDHFSAALAGSRVHGGPIDYDHRRRNVPMETDRAAALTAIQRLVEELVETSTPVSASAVRVRVMLAADGAEAEFTSTLGRELAFAAHHAIHHHAMIKAIAEELGLKVPCGFGMAPSTMNFEQSRHPAGER